MRKFKHCFRFIILLLNFSINNLFAEQVDFKVGIVIPLSGALAEYGTAIRNGFEMAKTENADLYSRINFVYEDSGYDGKTAVNALQKLKAEGSFDLYYLWGVSPTEAMLPIAVQDKLAVIAETTIKEATVGKEFVIRAARTGERIAMSIASELELRKVQNVSLLVTLIPFYDDIVKHLKVILNKKNIKISNVIEVLPSEFNFKTFLLNHKRIKEEAPIGAFLLPDQLITFYKQMDQLRMKNQTFNSDILDSSTIIKECPDTVNNAFFTQVGVVDTFREKYKNTFKNDVHIGSAAQAYDIAVLIKDLFGNLQNKLEVAEIINKISLISSRNGVTGNFVFTDSLENGKELRMPVSMKMVRNKKIEVITEDTKF